MGVVSLGDKQRVLGRGTDGGGDQGSEENEEAGEGPDAWMGFMGGWIGLYCASGGGSEVES